MVNFIFEIGNVQYFFLVSYFASTNFSEMSKFGNLAAFLLMSVQCTTTLKNGTLRDAAALLLAASIWTNDTSS